MGELLMSYEAKLMQMKKLLKKDQPQKIPEVPSQRKIQSPQYEEQWLRAGLLKEENDLGIVYKRVVTYPSNYRHGHFTLSGIQQTLERWKEEKLSHPLSPDLNKPLLFFDTETTGLKGAGTLIFLIGFIEYTGSAFTLTQYVLPGPEHEAAFLYATKFWEEQKSIVMYNGKSFDMPMVETRWTMNRNELPPLLRHTEIDLLHGSKRIWKNEMDTFKLTTVEEEQLGFFRDGDIPGHMAPIIYQDAVKNGRAELLMKVLHHNEWDILSLVTLYIRSTDLLLNKKTYSTETIGTNIGKWFADLKSFDRSKAVLEQVISQSETRHPMAYYHLGFLFKKEEEFEKAAMSFSIAAEGLDGRERIIAYEELAKLFEHKLKELQKALSITREAIHLLKREKLTERFKLRMEISLANREMRLNKKLFPGEAQ